jgi:hypothetical protein
VKDQPENRHPLLSSSGQFNLILIVHIDNSAVNTSQKKSKFDLKLVQANKLLGMGGYL